MIYFVIREKATGDIVCSSLRRIRRTSASSPQLYRSVARATNALRTRWDLVDRQEELEIVPIRLEIINA